MPSELARNTQRVDELAASLGGIVGFVLDRRVEVLADVPVAYPEFGTTLFIPTRHAFDRRLSARLDAITMDRELNRFLEHLRSLEPQKRDTIIAAIELHYGAALLVTHDPHSAYTLLVAALETLSREFGSPPTDWTSWDRAPKWDRLLESQGLSDEQAEAVRRELMRDRQLRLTETFCNYAAQVPDSFWTVSWKEFDYTIQLPGGTYGEYQELRSVKLSDVAPRDRDSLRLALRNSYRARSGFVHEGRHTVSYPEALSIPVPPEFDWSRRPLPFAVLRQVFISLIDREVYSAPRADSLGVKYTFEESR